MNTVSELLDSSIEMYRTLRDRLQQLSCRLGSISGQEAVAVFQELIELQKRCHHTDEKLMPLLSQNPADSKLAPQIWNRIQLLEEVIETNSRIMPQLMSRQAVLAAELKQSRESQGALFGYRSNEPVSGRRLNRSY
ncbi:MAG: hypothetical protein P8X63_01380 [Desulfuromonadaceae bacterium]|jgi:hypothetical protein